MALDVIGAGLGRTSTMSMKLALERLGLGPCYHMTEVFSHPEFAELWLEAANGRPDWERIFDGYRSTVDWPACVFWRELRDAYPDAKVLLTYREPQVWFRSIDRTILDVMRSGAGGDPPPGAMAKMGQRLVLGTFEGNIDDAEHVIACYRRHCETVIAEVPSDRLLVWRPDDGWASLCAFLDVPVPDEPFPHTNTTEDFRSFFALDV
jgi:hypothetical protein